MTWLEQSGWQFGYPKIQKYAHKIIPQNIQHQFSYTSHISLPLDVAKKHQFRKDMTTYGWEDIEWGTRLKNDGVSLFYEPDAKALHHHHITLEESLLRIETLGKSARLESKKNPQFDRAPKGIKLLAYQILSILPTMAGKHRKAFLRGYNQKI
jgi:GT2 family glycosyltransferase